MRRTLVRITLYILLAATLALIADWSHWRLQTAHGEGFEELDVTRVVVAPLKGGREEYYPDGTISVRCTTSLAPHTGLNPCWWLKQHRVLYDR